jgi:hypothetical protein
VSSGRRTYGFDSPPRLRAEGALLTESLNNKPWNLPWTTMLQRKKNVGSYAV